MDKIQSTDFREPLQLLRHYHDQIQGQLDDLERWLTLVIADKDAPEARQLGDQIDRFLAVADRLHHQDEEWDLFPYLNRESGKLADQIDQLKRQHKNAEQTWNEISPLVREPSQILHMDALRTKVEYYLRIQREHIQIENEELLPQAEHILNDADKAKIGHSMARRRGLNPG